MAVTCKAEHRELYAAIDGEVDHHRARKILGELVRQMDLVLPKKLTVDLGGVTFMDSSGIAILLRACRRQGIPTALEFPPGNHFENVTERTAAGIRWLLEH